MEHSERIAIYEAICKQEIDVANVEIEETGDRPEPGPMSALSGIAASLVDALAILEAEGWDAQAAATVTGHLEACLGLASMAQTELVQESMGL